MNVACLLSIFSPKWIFYNQYNREAINENEIWKTSASMHKFSVSKWH